MSSVFIPVVFFFFCILLFVPICKLQVPKILWITLKLLRFARRRSARGRRRSRARTRITQVKVSVILPEKSGKGSRHQMLISSFESSMREIENRDKRVALDVHLPSQAFSSPGQFGIKATEKVNFISLNSLSKPARS